MLYDPKWKHQTKAAPLTLEALVAWLETQPADRKYDYCKRRECLVAEYLKAQGAANYDLRSYEIPDAINRAVHPFGVCDWTYGAALARARKILALSSTHETKT